LTDKKLATVNRKLVDLSFCIFLGISKPRILSRHCQINIGLQKVFAWYFIHYILQDIIRSPLNFSAEAVFREINP
jgi:hypothetical protein